MTERHGFDSNVRGLTEYWRSLREVTPDGNNEAGQLAWAGGSFAIVNALAEVAAEVDFHIGSHARKEYTAQGYAHKDLRLDTEEERQERSRILAIMTAPHTDEETAERAGALARFFDKTLAGGKIAVEAFASPPYAYRPQNVAIDPKQPLFAGFDSHISDRVLHFTHSPQEQGPMKAVLHIAFAQILDEESQLASIS